MVHGQYDKANVPLEQPAAAAAEQQRREVALGGRPSKAYVPEDDRQHAELLATAVQERMVPHNEQLTEILDRIDATLARQLGAAQLSSEGQKVAQDLQDVVGATREAIEEKNQDELLQKIVYTTSRATQALANDPTAIQRARLATAVDAPTRQRLLDGMNNLARQFSMSVQFREVLGQLNDLLRALFFDDDDQQQPQPPQPQQQQPSMQGVQQPAQQDVKQPPAASALVSGQRESSSSVFDPTYGQFYSGYYSQFQQQQVDTSVQSGGSGFTSGQQGGGFAAGQQGPGSFAPGQQRGVGQQQSGFGQQQSGVGQQQSGVSSFGKQTGVSSFGKQGGDFDAGQASSFEKQGSAFPVTDPHGGLYSSSYGQVASSAPQQAPVPAPRAGQPTGLRDVPSQGSADDDHAYARKITNKTRQLIKNDMSPEKKERVVQRWVNVIRTANSDDGVRNGLNTMMDLMYELQEASGSAMDASGGLPPSRAEIEAESFIIAARHHLRRLIENLAGGRSLDFLRMALLDFQCATSNDEIFNRYARALQVFVHRSIADSTFVNDPSYHDTCLMMLQGAQEVARRHEAPTERLLFEIDELEDAIRNDEVTHKLGATSVKLVQDLFYDDNGRLAFKPELVDDLRQILIPIIADQLRYIAIPKITGSDEDMDYEVDNIIFRAKDVLPSSIRLENRTLLDISTSTAPRTAPTYWDTALLIRITDIVAELRDIKFAYRRKKFPKLHDRGELDVVLGGHGIGIDSELLAARNDPNHLFRVGDVHCTCSKIDIENMAGEEHRLMYTLLKPIIESRVRRNIIMSVEEAVRKVLCIADERLFKMRNMSIGGSSVDTSSGASWTGRGSSWATDKSAVDVPVGSTSSRTSVPIVGQQGAGMGVERAPVARY